jgi:hypothetical protein
MEPVSAFVGIAASCWTLIEAVRTIYKVVALIKQNELQKKSEIRPILRDLSALGNILQYLQEYTHEYPNRQLEKDVVWMLLDLANNCRHALRSLEKLLQEYKERPNQKARLQTLRSNLSDTKQTLSNAASIVNLYVFI